MLTVKHHKLIIWSTLLESNQPTWVCNPRPKPLGQRRIVTRLMSGSSRQFGRDREIRTLKTQGLLRSKRSAYCQYHHIPIESRLPLLFVRLAFRLIGQSTMVSATECLTSPLRQNWGESGNRTLPDRFTDCRATTTLQTPLFGQRGRDRTCEYSIPNRDDYLFRYALIFGGQRMELNL